MLTPGMDNYGPRDGMDGQLGGYSNQAEIDLARWIAVAELGRPDAFFADHWDSAEEFEKSIRPPPFITDAAKGERYVEQQRKKLPDVQWLLANAEKIRSIAESLVLLAMFRPSSEVGLEYGDGMYLDFMIDEGALAKRDFAKVHCACPMLL